MKDANIHKKNGIDQHEFLAKVNQHLVSRSKDIMLIFPCFGVCVCIYIYELVNEYQLPTTESLHLGSSLFSGF